MWKWPWSWGRWGLSVFFSVLLREQWRAQPPACSCTSVRSAWLLHWWDASTQETTSLWSTRQVNDDVAVTLVFDCLSLILITLSQLRSVCSGNVVFWCAGIDLIATFYGCLYAGCVPVTVRPPHPQNLATTLPTVKMIVEVTLPTPQNAKIIFLMHIGVCI